jgi:hypothetical protein
LSSISAADMSRDEVMTERKGEERRGEERRAIV